MKAAVTGANSFLGRPIVKTLRERGWETVSIVRRFCDLEGEQLIASMEEYHTLIPALEDCDCLVHLAWNGTRGAGRTDEALQEQNYNHSMELIRATLMGKCRKVLLAGSQAEYGIHSEQITEETECIPNTAYGRWKLRLYEDASTLCTGQGVAVVEPRYFSVYGPGDYAKTMLADILRKMLADAPCDLTLCTQMWDYIYVLDAVDLTVRMLEKPGGSGIYNVASGDCRILREYVMEMARITGTRSELRFGAIPYPEGGAVSLWPDIRKACDTFQWMPKMRFAQGIKEMIKEMEEGSDGS